MGDVSDAEWNQRGKDTVLVVRALQTAVAWIISNQTAKESMHAMS